VNGAYVVRFGGGQHTMRRRLGELEHTSENSTDEVEVMAVEEEAHEIMASLENVRDLRPSEDGRGTVAVTGSWLGCCSVFAAPATAPGRTTSPASGNQLGVRGCRIDSMGSSWE
jgi:hypothetical protein